MLDTCFSSPLDSFQPFERLSAIAPAGRCFAIDTELSARQQALAVLKHFDIVITKENIFSRCQVSTVVGAML